MRDRIRGREVWETVGLDTKECDAYVDQSEFMKLFRNHLFTRIVPIVKDIGLWGPKVQKAYMDMGVFEMGNANLDALMKADEDIAEELDREKARAEAREVEVRIAEIEQTIAVGDGEGGARRPAVGVSPRRGAGARRRRRRRPAPRPDQQARVIMQLRPLGAAPEGAQLHDRRAAPRGPGSSTGSDLAVPGPAGAPPPHGHRLGVGRRPAAAAQRRRHARRRRRCA